MKLLHIDSSILGESSASRRLSAAIVAAFARAVPNLEIVRRDLDADPIPHLGWRGSPEPGEFGCLIAESAVVPLQCCRGVT
jgi:hypothetical protein